MSALDILKLLADSTRLRVLALLRCETLSVAELQDILEMGQSRISSHLGLLRQGGLVVDRKDGKKTFYSLNPELSGPTRGLIDSACESASQVAAFRTDAENLQRIMEKRRRQTEAHFNAIAGRLSKDYCPGRSWQAVGHALLHLVPAIDIADLGAGEGMLSQLLARQARTVVCIDNSERMVEVGAELARREGITNLEYRLGDIEAVPLEDASVDLALLSQALHHAQNPQRAVDEAARIVRPGGRVLVLDLAQHDFEQARELYADTWLGFPENTLYQFLRKARLSEVQVNPVAKEREAPHFVTLLASGRKRQD